MKFKAFMIAALAAVVGMTACSKDDGAGKTGNGDEKAVLVTVQGEGINSRAVGDKKGSGTVTLTNGKIIFTNASEIATHVITIVAGNAAYDKDASTVGQTTLAGGAAFTELDPTTQKVYLIGNYAGTIAKNTDLRTLNLTQFSQYKTDGGIDNVTIFGGTTLNHVDDNNYSATFTAKPVISRMEIEKLTAGGAIVSYDLTGIFINRYYDQTTLLGTVTTANLINNSFDKDKYAENGTGGSYLSANKGAIYDYSTTGLDKDAGAGKAYAYNCLALPGDDGAMVSVVIRLSNIKLTGNVPFGDGSDQFLTIQNFYKNQGTPQETKITSLERGNIYTIPEVAFTEDDLTPQPETKSINAEVKATIMDWVSQVIGYDFN